MKNGCSFAKCPQLHADVCHGFVLWYASNSREMNVAVVRIACIPQRLIVYYLELFLSVSPESTQVVAKHAADNGKTFMMN